MPRKKRRSVRPKDPCIFSIRLSKENLGRLNEIHEDMLSDSRNETINRIIGDYFAHQVQKDLFKALRTIIRKLIKEEIKGKR